ncbi:MAG: hypothetical protein WA919_00150 [Coleofasciculaceae cyanobacterium]
MKLVGFFSWFLLVIISTSVTLLITTSPASAQIRQIDITLNSSASQTFTSLIEQAEFLAKSAIDQEFAQDKSLQEVSVTIVGERNGQLVPLLITKVSRSEWQKEPKVQTWVRYLADSEVLLGFREPLVTQSAANASRAVATKPPRLGSITVNTGNRAITLKTGSDVSEQNDYGDGRGFDDEDD